MFKKILLSLLLIPGVVMFAHAGPGSGGTLYNPPRTQLGAYAGADYIGYKVLRITSAKSMDITTDTYTLGYGVPGAGYTLTNQSTGSVVCPCALVAVKWSTGGVITDFALFKDTWQSVQQSSFTRFNAGVNPNNDPRYVPEYTKVYNAINTASTSTLALAGGVNSGLVPGNGVWVPASPYGPVRFEKGITVTLNTNSYNDIEFLLQEIR